MSFEDDYLKRRAGTFGGDQALKDDRPIVTPLFNSPPAVEDSVQESAPKPPRPPYQMTKADLSVGVLAFLVAWLMFWRMTNMGAGASAAVGFIVGAVGARWWRHLLIAAIVGAGIAIYLHSK